jgi:hypothetical protein
MNKHGKSHCHVNLKACTDSGESRKNEGLLEVHFGIFIWIFVRFHAEDAFLRARMLVFDPITHTIMILLLK